MCCFPYSPRTAVHVIVDAVDSRLVRAAVGRRRRAADRLQGLRRRVVDGVAGPRARPAVEHVPQAEPVAGLVHGDGAAAVAGHAAARQHARVEQDAVEAERARAGGRAGGHAAEREVVARHVGQQPRGSGRGRRRAAARAGGRRRCGRRPRRR